MNPQCFKASVDNEWNVTVTTHDIWIMVETPVAQRVVQYCDQFMHGIVLYPPNNRWYTTANVRNTPCLEPNVHHQRGQL